jgi:hypothetical protein
MALPVLVIPTKQFGIGLDQILDLLDDQGAEELLAGISEVISAFEHDRWQTMTIQPYSPALSVFFTPLTGRLILVFGRETDRDGRGRPLRIRIELHAVQSR